MSDTPSKHDKKVAQLARQLERQDWNVCADLPGYDKPPTIGKKNPSIPDIYATKRGHTKIVEVATPASITTDVAQHATFRRHVNVKNNTTFKIEMTS